MRPIDRPSKPSSYDGVEYNNAQQPLVAAFGSYCSYCERYLPAKADVEHKMPKSIYPLLETDWTNFLIACANCNSAKGTRECVYLRDSKKILWCEREPGKFLCWPDELYDNSGYIRDTFNMIQYQELGLLHVHPKVTNKRYRDRIVASLTIVNLAHVLNTAGKIEYLWFRAMWRGSPTYPPAMGRMSDLDVSGEAPDPALMKKVKKEPTWQKKVVKGTRAVPTARSDFAKANRGAAGNDVKDYRVPQRSETWDLAHFLRARFDQMVLENFVDTAKNGTGLAADPFQKSSPREIKRSVFLTMRHVINLAKAKGFWSVWVTAFKEQDPLASAEFKARYAIVPVLDELLKRENFPATRTNLEFNPPIYEAKDNKWVEGVLKGRLDPFVEVDKLKDAEEKLKEELEDSEIRVSELEYLLEDAELDRELLRDTLAEVQDEKLDLEERMRSAEILARKQERKRVEQKKKSNQEVFKLRKQLENCGELVFRLRRELSDQAEGSSETSSSDDEPPPLPKKTISLAPTKKRDHSSESRSIDSTGDRVKQKSKRSKFGRGANSESSDSDEAQSRSEEY